MRCTYCGCYTVTGFVHPRCSAAAQARAEAFRRSRSRQVSRLDLLLAAGVFGAFVALAIASWWIA